MLRLRRVIANLWTPAPRGDEGGDGTTAGATRPHAPRVVVGEAQQEGAKERGEEKSSAFVRPHEPLPRPTRELIISNPWGTRDPQPPTGWSTAAHENSSRIRWLHSQRRASSPPPPLSAYASDGDRRGRVIISSDGNLSSIKRRRDRRAAFPTSEDENGPLLELDQVERLWNQDHPSRRRRQCPTGSSYVSPAQTPLPEIDAEAELDLQRSWPPPRLTFRAGLIMRAVSRRRAAKKSSRSRSTATSRRRRRERELDTLVLRAYEATHPSAPQGEADGEDEQDLRSYEDASRARREKEEAFWSRLRRVEEERDQQVEEKLASRRNMLERLRAEADAEFADALAAKEHVITLATAALEAAPGPDMTALRSLFGGKWDSRPLLKDDREVQQLRERFLTSDGVLNGIKEAQAEGEWTTLEKLLETAEESGLKSQREFVSAREALRSAKDRATKAAEDQATKDASLAAAETMVPAPAAAPTAPGLVAGHQAEVIAQEAVRRSSAPTFLQRAQGLKKAVEARRASNDALLVSTDPAIKRMRMAFKKAYQGSLNKLACSPSSVSLVMREIHEKSNAPLTEARMGGYINRAREFFLYNIAAKLVDYAERDHFSAESYRMAFPLACVAVDLMAEHQHLAELFLGTLYSRCPSAIPALSFNTAGMSDTEVMSLLGKLEGENMTTYLNRTKGLIVLMAAVMQTTSSRSGELPHPFPLAEGWRWLTRFLNGLTAYVRRGNPPPFPTGPVLEWFLKVAGFELQRRYGKAFHKVVLIVKMDVLPILLPRSKVPHLLDVVIQDYESTDCRFLLPAGRDTEFRDFRPWGET